jgi:hypothetical protein
MTKVGNNLISVERLDKILNKTTSRTVYVNKKRLLVSYVCLACNKWITVLFFVCGSVRCSSLFLSYPCTTTPPPTITQDNRMYTVLLLTLILCGGVYFRKSVEQIKLSLKSDKNIGYFTGRTIYIYYCISLIFSSNQKCFRQNLQRKSKHRSSRGNKPNLCPQWSV